MDLKSLKCKWSGPKSEKNWSGRARAKILHFVSGRARTEILISLSGWAGLGPKYLFFFRAGAEICIFTSGRAGPEKSSPRRLLVLYVYNKC